MEEEEAGRRCSKILINIGTCVWGAPTRLRKKSQEADFSRVSVGPWLWCEISAPHFSPLQMPT